MLDYSNNATHFELDVRFGSSGRYDGEIRLQLQTLAWKGSSIYVTFLIIISLHHVFLISSFLVS